MGTYFHGWRRKVGCVVLMMAMMTSVAWGRSFLVADVFLFSTSVGRWHIVTSELGEFQWLSSQSLRWRKADWGRYPIPPTNFYPQLDHENSESYVRYTELVSMGPTFKLQSFELTLAYWMIVGPLTLLSAILILWPKKKSPKQTLGVIVNAAEEDPESVQNLVLESPLVTR
ncbi:MAG TPA: hypothetical protein VGM98_17570 [Schlesneria sp.]|jgi:hypothetical protein